MPVETACLHGVAKGDGACRVAAGKRIQSGFKLARIVRPVKAWYGAGNFGRGRHEGGNSRRIRFHIGKRHGSFRHGAGQRVPNGRGKTCRHQSPNCLFHTALHHWTETIDLLVVVSLQRDCEMRQCVAPISFASDPALESTETVLNETLLSARHSNQLLFTGLRAA